MARVWSPSFVLIPRMIARCFASRAILGRCSPIIIPGTLVWIGLNGPLLA